MDQIELENAMVEYFGAIELELVGTDEEADPEHIDGQFILDRIQTETDLLDRVAQRIKNKL